MLMTAVRDGQFDWRVVEALTRVATSFCCLTQHLLRLNGDGPVMHGSYLCHHGLCVNPSHVIYDDSIKNLP